MNTKVKNFLQDSSGTKVITRVLVANNGMAAVKAIRSVRKWSYETFEDEKAIWFVAMATPEDLKNNAEYIRMADQFIEIPGGSAHNNYNNVDLIVDTAESCKADAVWVGWGYQSENPVLAERLAAIGITFIGPPPTAMRSLGDKIASTIVAQSAQVPCVSWSGDGVFINADQVDTVPDEMYQQATVTNLKDGLAHATRIGFPVMVKASEGGGGKGIRLVYEQKHFDSCFIQVQREVPGSPIFVMQVVQNARHLEVQLLADQYGNAIALFGRDCSVQRRHQKIIEEAPVTVAPPEILRAMEQSAVNLAKLVGYTSAGTVEYLYEPDKGKYYFLELNPRLQVEHPTTEMVSGVNIPAAQLQIAMGIPLSNIKDIRILYGMTPHGKSPIDFDFKKEESKEIQRRPTPRGHVIAARITAENPAAGFKPNSGKFLELNFKSNSNVWGYFSVNAAGGVHEFADSQFGHLFAYGESREEARKSLVMALKEIQIRGDFRTTVEYLVKLLEAPTFQKNEFTTSWLDRLISQGEQEWEETDSNSILAALCGAIARTFTQFRDSSEAYLDFLSKGKLATNDYLNTYFKQYFIISGIQYEFQVRVNSMQQYTVMLRDCLFKAVVKPLADGGVLVVFAGKSHIVYIKEENIGATLMVDGTTFIMEKENDPTQLKSPSPGKLVRYLVKNGDHINAGDAYAEIEVMKMYMPLISKESGVFTALKPVSSVLSNGDVVGSLELDDPSCVQKAKPFDGHLSLTEPTLLEEKPHQKVKSLAIAVDAVMEGFEPDTEIETLVAAFCDALRDPRLPMYELAESLGSISSRIPQELSTFLYKVVELKDGNVKFDCSDIKKRIQVTVDALPLDDQDPMLAMLQPVFVILDRYENGTNFYSRSVIDAILKQYFKIESLFESAAVSRVMLQLREEHMESLETVMSIARAVSKPKYRTELILRLLEVISKDLDTEATLHFSSSINSLAQLTGSQNAQVSFKAREILIGYQLPSLQQRRESILAVFSKVHKKAADGSCVYLDFSQLNKLLSSRYSMLDIVPEIFFYKEHHLRAVALYAYVMRTSSAFTISSFEHHYLDNSVAFVWDFASLDQSITQSDQVFGIHTTIEGKKAKIRKGVIFMSENLESVVDHVKNVLLQIELPDQFASEESFGCYATVVLKTCNELDSDENAAKKLQDFVYSYQEFLQEHKIKRLTFMIQRTNFHSRYFTFKASLGFQEDQVIRHIEPFMSDRLELSRLENFEITPTEIYTRGLRIYHAVGKQNPSDKRFFVRGIIHPSQVNTFYDFFFSEATRITDDILDTLELLMATHTNTDCNHILLHFLPVFHLTKDQGNHYLERLLRKNMSRFAKLRITEVEVCFLGFDSKTNKVVPFRLVVEIKSKFVLEISWYVQEKDSVTGQLRLNAVDPASPLNGLPVYRLHEPRQAIQPKRYQAHLLGTVYVYDFPALFEEALKRYWHQSGLESPQMLMKCTELVLNSSGELEEASRSAGMNSCGMVAFKMELFTPEFPKGRTLIVISNDITFQMGSFGPTEDLVFLRASQLARKLGVPRIYLSANSGARIGLADEVLNKFKIAWIDSSDMTKGFEYLYLEEMDYNLVNSDPKKPSVTAEKVIVNGICRYKLTAIIGQKEGLGVENLHGSGEIAGETSLAYQEIFTLTLVTCRSVGIGAYLNRLGQRVIQVEYAPIILTGAGALNKVLGRQVYSSNLQLGGTRIMYHNGVSHLTAENDLEGVMEILKWLSFVPAKKNDVLPIMNPVDPVDRVVEIPIPKGAYDPRELLQGAFKDGVWQSGFFDRGSFKETLCGWAKGIVAGRARLGGIPVGVISVETRTTETVIFADPALETSQEETIKEAGQVWYPNSAFKTAQAIRDFNHGEQLPLFIFANWRGFSGGQSDMYKEVLKFGAQIVDSLREFKQPIFIYIIGELRGGAWVVVDPSINSEMMEMYCYEDARGGVLEPQGIVEIKYRTPKILATMERVDPFYSTLKKQLDDPSKSEAELVKVSCQIKEYEKSCLGIYEQAAVELADLHDRPQRMLQKGVIRDVVDWKTSREYFYWRLLRRVKEKELSIKMKTDLTKTISKVVGWLEQDLGDAQVGDQEFIKWYRKNESSIEERLDMVKKEAIRAKLEQLYLEDPELLKSFMAARS